MDSKRQEKVSEIHPELFHYTSETGLFGILRSQSLRATHWRYLNDMQEFIYLKTRLASMLEPDLAKHAEDFARRYAPFDVILRHLGGPKSYAKNAARELLERLFTALLERPPDGEIFEFYLTSSCTPEGDIPEVRENGLLSQWRCYGKDGGFALVFDTKQLEVLCEVEVAAWPSSVITLGDVAYSSDPPEILNKRLETLPVLREAVMNFVRNNNEATAEATLNPFIQCCARFKHWAFHEEREVRLVAILNGPRMHEEHADAGTPLRERERTSFERLGNAVPCINLFDGLPTQNSHRLPIRRIIVGPGPNQAAQEQKLSKLLDELQLKINVSLSDIPLRF